MRYEYTITKEGAEAEMMQAMSWKKLFKKLLMKYPKFSGWCTYMNKKGHLQQRSFNNGREVKNLWTTQNVRFADAHPNQMNGPHK